MDDVEEQWRVIWFPPDREDQVKTGTEGQVRRMAKEQIEWSPIIEKRLITTGPWEQVENLVGRGILGCLCSETGPPSRDCLLHTSGGVPHV